MKTIPIDGVIGLDVTTASIRSALAGAGDVDLKIQSGGGSAYDCIGIHNLLAEHRRAGHQVTASIDGLCASAATYIAAAANHIRVPANGVWMVHRPWTMVLGTASDFQHVADQLGAVESIMVDGYPARTGRAREAIAAEVADETFLYGQQIVDAGYADELIPGTDQAPSDRTAALAFAKGALADTQAKLRSHGETLDPERLAALIGPSARAPTNRPLPPPPAPPPAPAGAIAPGAQAERERITGILAALDASDPRTLTALELVADPNIGAETAARILARLPAQPTPAPRSGPSEFEKHMAALGNPPIGPDSDPAREPATVDWASAFKDY
ncbi:MAG: Clp protease ClpP [Chromatiaceae bacterium]|nr:Clp protease ClpP [Chromatiaceae bacterium]